MDRTPALERHTEHELHQPAARILGAVDVTITSRDLVLREARARLRDRREVDVVERIQQLGAEFEVAPADQRHALDEAQVEAPSP